MHTMTAEPPKSEVSVRPLRRNQIPEIRELCRLSRLQRKRSEKARGLWPKKEPEAQHPHRHAMRLKDGIWHVRVPKANGGRTHLISTGEKSISEALKVVDASGVQKLSIMARAKCLTADVAQILIAGHNQTCAQIASTWHHHLRMDSSGNTPSSYYGMAKQLFNMNDCANKPMNAITREMLYSFVNDTATKESTRRLRLTAINSLYRHAAGFGHVIGNLASTIKINKSLLTVDQRQRIPAVPFTEDEFNRIVTHRMTDQYWRWFCTMAWWLGLRMSDVCRYEVASLGEDFAVLYPKKNGRKLLLPLSDPLIGGGQLKAVFDEIRATLTPGQVYCFPRFRESYPNGFPGHYSHDFNRMLRHVGIEGKTFHGFRHAFRLRLSASGKTIEEVADLMGHTDTKVTEGYGRASA